MQRKDGELNYAILQIPGIRNLSKTVVYSPDKYLRSPLGTGNASYLASASTNLSNDFIDKHKTFYNNLFGKLEIDMNAKRVKRPPLNFNRLGYSEEPEGKKKKNLNNSEINFVELNKQKLKPNLKVKAYDDMFEEENRKRGLDPRKMIKGVDELVQRIERNFDKKTGKLRVPQSINEYKNEQLNNEEKKKTEMDEYAEKNHLSKKKLEKLRNAVKFSKEPPMPLGHHSGFDSLIQKTEEASFIEGERLEFTLPELIPSKKVHLETLNANRSSSISPQKQKKLKTTAKAQTEVKEKKKELLKPIETIPFKAPEIVEPISKNEHEQKMFKKLKVFVEKGDEAIKANVVRRSTVFVYEMNKKSGQAFTKKQSILYPGVSTEALEKTLNVIPEDDHHDSEVQQHHQRNLHLRPVIMNQENKAFILENYYLDDSYKAQSFGASLANKEDIKTLVLNNNRLNDENIYDLIMPYVNKKITIEIFRCVRNHIGNKFATIFEKTFYRLNEDVLRELTLDGCTIDEESLTSILNTLLSVRSRIRYLSLANVGLGKLSLKPLKKLVGITEYMVHLDISKNNLPAISMYKLCKRLPNNKTLKHVNFSFNSISIQDNSCAVLLKRFASNNECLTVLNLSFTGLNDFEISLIMEGAQKSKSLMSIHLAGNMLTAQTFQNTNSILKAKPKYYKQFKPFNDILERRMYSREQYAPVTCYNNANYKRWAKNLTTNDDQSKPSNDLLPFKKKDPKIKEITQDNVAPDNIIYYRILDNDLTIDANCWVQSYNCWITERWRKIDVSFRVPVEAIPDERLIETDAVDPRPATGHIEKRGSDIESMESSQISMQTKIKDMNMTILIKGTFTREEHIEMKYNPEDHMYHFIDYIPPGLHHYTVSMVKDKNYESGKILVETDLNVNIREKEIRPALDFKDSPSKNLSRKEFIHSRSVFAEFRLDSEAVARTSFENDYRFIKISHMNKPEDIEKTLVLLQENFIKIKNIFLYYIARSPNYPFLNLEATLGFVKDIDFIDEKISLSEITKAFYLTNVEEEEQEDNPNTLLCRFEFFEIICRLGILKFYDKRRVPTQYEGIFKLLEDNVFKLAPTSYSECHEFRIKKIYTIEIDELLKANLDELEKIYKRKKLVSGLKYEDLYEALKELDIEIPMTDFNILFSYSKMTILHEEKDRKKKRYRFHSYCEFLEFLVRLANHLEKDSPDPLHEKLERFLIRILKKTGAQFFRYRAEKI